MHFFTSITTCYLPKARVLAETLKKHNPSAVMHLVISDDLPENFNLENEDFDYVWQAEDFIKTENNKKWFFMHSVVELCTAVKGAAALHILQQTNADKLVYLDPDIGVFGDLTPLSQMLDKNSLLITPHQVEPAVTKRGVIDEEICSLKHGVYNFGFFAVKNDNNGLRFLNWWNERLMNFCYDDIPNGLFTDQKWGDLIPALFDFAKVVRDVEYNVATWNLATRKISGDDKYGWMVNGRPLKFYHFTGFDSGAHRIMLSQHANEDDPVWNLSLWYENKLQEKGQSTLGKTMYKYAFYSNGEKIAKEHRKLFRQRLDVYDYFSDPFGDECYAWMRVNCNPNKGDIVELFKNMYKYKVLYKLSLFAARRRNKEKFKYYRDKIMHLQEVINAA